MYKCTCTRARIKDLEGQGHFQKGHFRLRRALRLSKKAPRPSKKRHKGQQKKRAANSKGGGGDSDTFFSDLKKNIPQKEKEKARRQLSLDRGALSVHVASRGLLHSDLFGSAPALGLTPQNLNVILIRLRSPSKSKLQTESQSPSV